MNPKCIGLASGAAILAVLSFFLQRKMKLRRSCRSNDALHYPLSRGHSKCKAGRVAVLWS